MDRREIKLRAFLKQPLVGASVTRSREALQVCSASNGLTPLPGTVRELYARQAPAEPVPIASRALRSIARDDLHLVFFEYVAG